MRRRVARGFFVLVCGGLAAGLGVATALLYAPAGRRLLARLLSEQAPHVVRGRVHIGAVRGSWFRGFALDSVVIHDTAGVRLAEVPHLEVRYRLADLLAGRIVIASARLQGPDVQVIKHRGGRLNYEEIFRLSEGPPGRGPGQLIEVRDLTVEGGRLTLRLPWNPDGRLRTRRQADSALAAERARPGRRIEAGPEGLVIVRTLDRINGRLPLLQLSTPNRGPTSVILDRLATTISDPAIEVRRLDAALQTKNDSLLFRIARAELPGSAVQGEGRIDWPRDTLLYHFTMAAERVSLADLRWVSPQFPDFTGTGSVRASSLSGSRTEWDIPDLSVGDSASHVAGRLVAITDSYRGLGFRNLGVDLTALDLDDVRPYLDTLPFYGTLTGRLDASGFFDAMTVGLDWRFRDRMVPGAESTVGLAGTLGLGGGEGIVFQQASLPHADLDLGTVRRVAPAVILEGRLGLVGTLTGPWKNVVFEGTAEHRDGERPLSVVRGRSRLDTRGALFGLESDVVLDTLSFEGIRRAFPALTARGSLSGRVRLEGFTDRMAIDADVTGAVGRVRALGQLQLLPPRWGADSLRLTFSQLDLAAVNPGAPESRLAGSLTVTGSIDSAVAPSGRLVMALGPGRIREFRLDSATARLEAADSVIRFDTVAVRWRDGRLDGAGALGWAPPHGGTLRLRGEATDLAAFDTLARRVTGLRPDSTRPLGTLHGRGEVALEVSGSLPALVIDGRARADSLAWLEYRARGLESRLAYRTGDTALEASLQADTVGARNLRFAGVTVEALGHRDAFGWKGGFRSGAGDAFQAAGRLTREPGAVVLRADSLRLRVAGNDWALAVPVDARVLDSVIVLDSTRLVTPDGSGSLAVAGSVPRTAPGHLSVTAFGVALKDLYGLAQRDTSGIEGTVTLDARLGGTARAPELRGSGALTGGRFGDFQAPLVRAAFDYRDRLLRSNLTFWRTGKPVVELDASVPLDLALAGAETRRLPGPLTITATGDSIDLALVEAFTPNLRQVSGILDIDARVEGTWARPRLAGGLRLRDGRATVPALGVRYGPASGRLRLAGDSIVSEGLTVAGNGGELTVSGGVRLEELTRPVLGLDLSARDFELINVPDFLKARATGDVRLGGPLLRPVLTGTGRVRQSVVYFADLITKEIVNLEDPLNADLVDTLKLREEKLGANFQSRFLDSLAIRDLDLIIGDEVWLRSNEANFQLEGRLRVNKTRKVYRMDGTLDTPRGTYTLKAGGFINKTFTVERGTVRYFGDLNAELDVQARHVVQTPGGSTSDVPVIAQITGTLQVPRLRLTTPPDRPPMSDQELISLLMLGTREQAAGQLGTSAQQLAAVRTLAVTGALSGVTSELSRALSTGVGGIVEIRPGVASTGLTNIGTAATQLAIGRAITNKLFVTANAGFCFSNASALSARNLGASLEYRFRRDLRLVLSAEPLSTCFAAGTEAFITNKRYQFGSELRWDRDY